MHYKNGRLAKLGDQVLVPNGLYSYLGILIETTPNSTCCNGKVVLPINSNSVTLSDLVHYEDVIRGLEPQKPCDPKLQN